MSVRRNEACPCGSNRKFKNCCLPLHQERARWDPVEDRLREMIEDFFDSEEFVEDFANAMHEYGAKPEDREDVSKWRMFMDWYVHDYVTVAGNETIIKAFLRRKGAQFDDLVRDIVRSWSESTLSFYEVTGITRGTGFDIKDIFSGREFFVFDLSGSESLSRYDLIFARLYRVGDITRLSGEVKVLPHTDIDNVREFVVHSLKSSGSDAGSIPDYFRKHSLDVLKFIDTLSVAPDLVTPEGDMILLSKAEYRVASTRRVSNILKSSEQFVYLGVKKKVHRFDWITDAQEEPHEVISARPGALAVLTHMELEGEGESRSVTVMGNLSLKQDSLVVECVSEQRLQRCKKIVEGLLAGLVYHVGDTYREAGPEDATEGYLDDGEPDLAYEELSPQLRRGLKKYFENYYKKWLDTRIPALGNITPLEASKTPQGRMVLEDFLKDMENMREREGAGDSPAYPVEMLRRRLRL